MKINKLIEEAPQRHAERVARWKADPQVNDMMRSTAPDRIWFTKIGKDILPNSERVTAEDVEYVRADLARAPLAEALVEARTALDEAEAEIERQQETADAAKRLWAKTEAERDAAKKAAQDYCWQRYSDRPPLNLRTPAVFTSHEWQKIGEAIDDAIAHLGAKP